MTTALPDGWSVVPLDDLLVSSKDLTYGIVQPGPTVEGGVPIVRVKDVRDGRVDLSDPLEVGAEVEANYQRSRLRGGELLITLVGTVGEVAVAGPELAGWNVARAVGVARIRPEVGARWVAWSLGLAGAVNRIAERVNTTVQTTLNLADLRQLPIPIPPEHERIGIAETLAAIDDKVESAAKISAYLEQIAQAHFRSWFTEFEPWGGTAPSEWKAGRLGDVLSLVKAPTKAGQDPDRPYVPIDTVPIRSLGLQDFRPNEDAQSSLTLFNRNDILIGAMRVYFHRVSIAPFDGITRTTCFVLRPEQRAYLEYALLLCNEESTIDYADASSKGSTMPYAVWEGALANMPVLIPPADVAQRFSELVGPLVSRVRDGLYEMQRLKRLRAMLLPELMVGRIRVPEAMEAIA